MDQLTIVLSGPKGYRSRVVSALRRAGYEIGPEDHGHGLPSYTDPVTAHEAKKPNSGHTPGTPHPAELVTIEDGKKVAVPHDCEHVGDDYEDDPRIAWITCRGPHPDDAQRAAETLGWQERMHGYRTEATPDPVLEIVRTWGAMQSRVKDLEEKNAEMVTQLQAIGLR